MRAGAPLLSTQSYMLHHVNENFPSGYIPTAHSNSWLFTKFIKVKQTPGFVKIKRKSSLFKIYNPLPLFIDVGLEIAT